MTLKLDIPCMILAAGRGERMRPLTDHVPKPLLEIHGQSLLDHHLSRLKDAGFENIVINHAWLGHLIEEALGDGSTRGLKIKYSGETQALETAGGIRQALPLLNPKDYFFVINGDVYCPDFPFHRIGALVKQLRAKLKLRTDASSPSSMADTKEQSDDQNTLAYLFLVPNPEHHPKGDFFLDEHTQGQVFFEASQATKNPYNIHTIERYTFSGAGLYHKSLFANLIPGEKAALAPLLKEAMSKMQAFGELLSCSWHDVGTPQRLEQLNK
jgi:MurNAc alpha-1-phosphate uridylyltransferase